MCLQKRTCHRIMERFGLQKDYLIPAPCLGLGSLPLECKGFFCWFIWDSLSQVSHTLTESIVCVWLQDKGRDDSPWISSRGLCPVQAGTVFPPCSLGLRAGRRGKSAALLVRQHWGNSWSNPCQWPCLVLVCFSLHSFIGFVPNILEANCRSFIPVIPIYSNCTDLLFLFHGDLAQNWHSCLQLLMNCF